MKKVCLITHIADPDGAFPIILSRLVFDSVDDYSCESNEVDEILNKIIENKIEYDAIYITDLNITEKMAAKIFENPELSEKIKVFDHHQSNEYLNKYPFINVVVEQNGKKECGTTLFYKHLKTVKKSDILEKDCLKTLIEYVRQNDTYDFIEENKQDVLNFRNLYDIYGREKYINHFIDFVNENDKFSLSETEMTLIEIEEERTKRYIEEKLQHVKKAIIDGVKVGIVFAESNRSILGHEIARRMEKDVDIAVLIDIDRAISYRADKDEIDVSVLAVPYGGGGHKHASGSPLPEGIKQKIVENIFQNVVWEEN